MSGLPPERKQPRRKDRVFLALGAVSSAWAIINFVIYGGLLWGLLIVVNVPGFIWDWHSYWKRREEWERWRKRTGIERDEAGGRR